MNSSKTLAVVLIYLLSATWRQYSLRTLPPTVQEVSWTGWFTWAFLYAGYWVFACKRRRAPGQGNTPLPWHHGGWPNHFNLCGLSFAGVVAQFARSRGIFVFVTVSNMPLYASYRNLLIVSATGHPGNSCKCANDTTEQ
jgi:hypothetical protein